MKWFRFYSEVIHDPKIQTLSSALRWTWLSCLCLANENEPRGTLPSLKEIAYALRIPQSKAQEHLRLLIDANLINVDDSGMMRPHNWEGRQHKSDDVAQRVRQFRERQNGPPCNVTGNVTVAPRVRADSETDTESEEDPPNPPPNGGNENGARAIGSILGEKFANPAEVAKVADAVDALFPQAHFGQKVGQFATMYPPAWILKACQTAAGSGKNVGWSYIHSILKRYQNQGGPDTDAPTGRGSFGPKPAALPPSVEQVRAERDERDRNRKPIETTPEDIEKWKRWAEGPDASLRKIATQFLAELH